MKVWVSQRPWGEGVQIYAVEEGPGARYYLKYLGAGENGWGTYERVKIEEEGMKIEPLMSFSTLMAEEFFPQLIDQLWEMGIRPSDKSNEKEMSATRYHLEDLRTMLKLRGKSG